MDQTVFRRTVSVLCAVLLFLTAFMPGQPAYADDFAERPLSNKSVRVSERYSSAKKLYKKTTKRFADAASDTSFSLFKETVLAGKKNENILLSPDSVITVLAMMEAGAKGKTYKELNKALGGTKTGTYGKRLNGLHRRLAASRSIRYDTANSFWYRKGLISIKKKYLKKIVQVYGADLYKAPFDSSTVKDMNNWTYNHTHGKIAQIIDRLDPSARAVLMNAVYFKGSWATPYRDTVKRTFTSSAGKKKKVDMLEGKEHIYLEIAGGKGFVKYYEGGETAFAALLPPKGMSARTYAKKLTGAKWIKGYRNRTSEGVTVETRMPEFSYEYKTSLKKPLRKAGVKTAFTKKADFRNMTAQSVSVDDILHKTYIKLDKDGTEAAAVTAVVMKANSVFRPDAKIKKVYLNRPFVYAIIDSESGIPLFLGIVNEVK
ncbi:MAG: serpin family protein [Lachnospiraceae bacterium]|nr:serpin family protein [Lachnospiraceae bacterium]